MDNSRKDYQRTIRFTKSQKENLTKISEEWGTDFSYVVRYACDLFIDDYLPRDKRKKLKKK